MSLSGIGDLADARAGLLDEVEQVLTKQELYSCAATVRDARQEIARLREEAKNNYDSWVIARDGLQNANARIVQLEATLRWYAGQDIDPHSGAVIQTCSGRSDFGSARAREALKHGVWHFTVEGVCTIAGYGTVYTGEMVAEGEPALGAVLVTMPDGHIVRRQVRAFEKYAVQDWWRHKVSILLDSGDSVPVRSIMKGEVRRR